MYFRFILKKTSVILFIFTFFAFINLSAQNNKNNIISVADELKKLNDLKDIGIISELEFKQQKDKLFNE